MLDCVELETGPSPQWSVIWLHGLGADANDFVPLVPELVKAEWPAIRFVFPNAPERAVTINNGYRMRACYDISDMDFANRADMTGVRESIRDLDELVEEEIQRGVPADHIFIAGFSQGGAVTLSYGVRSTRKLAGLIALSTYLPAPAESAAEKAEGAEQAKIFMAHGTQDPVIPIRESERSAHALRAMGFDVEWQGYHPMQHSTCREEIDSLQDWMSARFNAGM